MKAVLETWNVGHDDELTFVAIGGSHYECGDEVIALMTDMEIGHPNIEARARLAACAPEMARLLLEKEWGSFDEMSNAMPGHPVSSCMSCTANMLEPDHDPDCRWLALMKKAGLR